MICAGMVWYCGTGMVWIRGVCHCCAADSWALANSISPIHCITFPPHCTVPRGQSTLHHGSNECDNFSRDSLMNWIMNWFCCLHTATLWRQGWQRIWEKGKLCWKFDETPAKKGSRQQEDELHQKLPLFKLYQERFHDLLMTWIFGPSKYALHTYICLLLLDSSPSAWYVVVPFT